MKSLLTLKTMAIREVLSFLKSVLVYFVDRLYKEWEHMLGNGRIYNEKASERGDLYAKQLIENIVHDRASEYDPYMLDGKATISRGTTSAVLGKAQVTGLGSLHRTNICSLLEEGNRLFIKVNLGAGPLTYRRQVLLRFGDFERKTAVQVSLINIKVSVDFSVEKETGRNGFLLKFAIDELNGFKLSVNGSGYFEWAINLFLSFWTLVLGRIVRNLLENELEQYVLKRLPKYQFPVEGTSYRNETKLNNHPEYPQNDETSLSESFYMERNHKKPKWSRLSPIGKKNVDSRNSTEHATEKDFGSKLGITNTSRCFSETNKGTTETNSFDLPTRNLDPCCEFLNKNSCYIPKDKHEEKCYLISDLTRRTRELSRSLNIVTQKLDSIQDITNSWSKEMDLKNCLNILDGCSLFDRNIPGDLNVVDEVEYNSESADSETSSPANDFENEQSVLTCKRRGKYKSKKGDLSKMFRVINENLGKSKLIEDIFSEISESSCKKNIDGSAFDMGIELPARFANASTLKKLDSSQIDENIHESISLETETLLNLARRFDSERREAQIEYLEKKFNGKKRKEKTEGSSKNRQVSVETVSHCPSPEGNLSARNLDSKLCSTEKFQNESLISCTVDEFEKHLKVFPREFEPKIEDPEFIKSFPIEKISRNRGVETPKTQYISTLQDKVDRPNLFSSNTFSDSMQQKMIQVEMSSDSDTEMVSTSLQFSENPENEKIPFKCVKVHTVEGLNGDSQLKEDGAYSENGSGNGEECIISICFSAHLGPCSVPLQKNSCKVVSKDETKGTCDPFSEISRDDMEITRGNSDSWSQESSQLEELACFNATTELTDSSAEYLSFADLKLNTNSRKNSPEETSHLKPLNDLQEQIIARTRKLVSDVVLDSDSEGYENSGSIPISSCKNLRYLKDKSIYNEDKGFSQNNSETEDLSEMELTSLESETSNDLRFPSDSDTETSEAENEPKEEM